MSVQNLPTWNVNIMGPKMPGYVLKDTFIGQPKQARASCFLLQTKEGPHISRKPSCQPLLCEKKGNPNFLSKIHAIVIHLRYEMVLDTWCCEASSLAIIATVPVNNKYIWNKKYFLWFYVEVDFVEYRVLAVLFDTSYITSSTTLLYYQYR